MPKAARERIANPRAGTALAPPFGLASREAPLDERDGRLVSALVTVVKRDVAMAVTSEIEPLSPLPLRERSRRKARVRGLLA